MEIKGFKSSLVFITIMIFVGVLTRTIFHLGPNIEFVTACSIAGTFYLKNKDFSILIPLLILAISDLIIGNSLIFIFTWTGFLIIPVISALIKLIERKFQFSNKLFKILLLSEGTGIVSTIVFFLWTNFGVVITTSMYEKNVSGVIMSYINGLPFLYNQLIGNLFIVPVVMLLTHSVIILLDNNHKKELHIVNKFIKKVLDTLAHMLFYY